MNLKILLLNVVILLFASCGSKVEISELKGSWRPINNLENSRLDISEVIKFENEGKYRAVTLYKEDSIVYDVNGIYHVNSESETINIKFTKILDGRGKLNPVSDSIFTLKILELSESSLSLESEKGILNFTKIK